MILADPDSQVKVQAEETTRWHIVLVAFAGEELSLTDTLAQIRQQSLDDSGLQLLCTDTPALHAAAGDYPVHFELPVAPSLDNYWLTLLRLLPQDAPVLILRAGCHLPQYWDARLMAVADQSPALTVISPLNVTEPFFALLNAKLLSAKLLNAKQNQPLLMSVDALDQWRACYSEGGAFDVPAISGAATLIQPGISDCLSAGLSNDAELMAKLRQQGAGVICTDQLVVDDSRVGIRPDSKAFANEVEQQSLGDAHPLTGMRHALTELVERQELPAQLIDCKPVMLHISHSWGGGLGRWVEDYIAADDTHNHLVLRSIGQWDAFGHAVALYPSARMDVPIKTWPLALPIVSTVAKHHQYSRVLEHIVERYRISAVMVSSLIGHSLDALRTTLPTLFVCHDFYPFCPALVATFDSPCVSCDAKALKKCRQENTHHRFFPTEADEHWLALRQQFSQALLAPEVVLVAPSASVPARLKQLEPALQDKACHIIEHGLTDKLVEHLSLARERAAEHSSELLSGLSSKHPSELLSERRTARLRVVILGSLAQHKGAGILDGILDELDVFADLWLLGAGDDGRRYDKRTNVTVIPWYDRDSLGEHLVSINPDIGLLLSNVPETFSYTLSELWAAAVPVLATRLGAFADRIEPGRNGWLADPDSRSVLAQLQSINEHRAELSEVTAYLQRAPVRSSHDMIQSYNQLLPSARDLPLATWLDCRGSLIGSPRSAQEAKALYIDHQTPYRRVLVEFLEYTAGKLGRSPRLPRVIRRLVSKVIRKLSQLLR
ncbi:glycosyltransferase [Nitrincola sp. MINF-07-Sa-05]|uniref:glycosyltransferase n=1 Tax=Nitrincola salilacus TaxID=3400273 RepID=UPI003917D693